MSKCAGGVQCPIGDTANVYSSVCFLESEKKQLNFTGENRLQRDLLYRL